MSGQKKFLEQFSLAATWLVLFAIAGATGGLAIAARDMLAFVSGGVSQIADAERTFGGMLSVIVGAIVLNVPFAYGVANLLDTILGSIKGSHIGYRLRNLGEGNHLFTLFVLVILEELFARYLFLGILTKISFLSGPGAFYAMVLVGNGLWALMHIPNFHDEDKSLLRVLPQFISGIFFSYVFVKFGFLATLLTHFGFNAVVFTTVKKQTFGSTNVLIFAYDAIVAFVALVFMGKPVTDIAVWFSDSPAFALSGWGFWDYLLLWAFVASSAGMIMNFLQYDFMPASTGGNSEKDRSFGEWIFIYVIGALISPLLVYAVYWAAGLFTDNVAHRIIIAAIIASFGHKSNSGSSVAKNFWLGLCQTYMTICTLFAIGFWAFIPFVFLQMAIGLPDNLIRKTYQEVE